MAGFERLVVGLGCAEPDASLIQYASLLARLGQSLSVRFVHVAKDGADHTKLREEMREKVKAGFSSPAEVALDVISGPLTDGLLDCAVSHGADLLVVGGKRRILGARLAMVAPCAIAVIPEGAAARLNHLMIAVDFSRAAGETVGWATQLAAEDTNIACTALHVINHESADLFADNEGEREQQQAVRDVLAHANKHGVAVAPRIIDPPRITNTGRNFILPSKLHSLELAQAILNDAGERGVDCLALSSRGRSRSASILLGSVAEMVIERSQIPLLIHKPLGAKLGLAQILLGEADAFASVKAN